MNPPAHQTRWARFSLPARRPPRDSATPVLRQSRAATGIAASPPSRPGPNVAHDRHSALGWISGAVPPQLARPGAVRPQSVPTTPDRAARPRRSVSEPLSCLFTPRLRLPLPPFARCVKASIRPVRFPTLRAVSLSESGSLRDQPTCSAGAAAGSAHALVTGALVSSCTTPVGARRADQSPRSGRRPARQARHQWAGCQPPRPRERLGSESDPGADQRTADRRSAASSQEWPAGAS